MSCFSSILFSVRFARALSGRRIPLCRLLPALIIVRTILCRFVLPSGCFTAGSLIFHSRFLRMETLCILIEHRFLAAFPQQIADASGDQIINDSEQRHADDHTDKSPDAPEKQDGKQDPEAGYTYGLTKDPGSEDIAVNLLQQDYKDQKYQTFPRAGRQDQQG
jgi:hypothetical protein